MATAPKFDVMSNTDVELGPEVNQAATEFCENDGSAESTALLKHTMMLQAKGYRVDEAADKLIGYMRTLLGEGMELTTASVLKGLFGDIQYHIVGLAIYYSSPAYKQKMNLEEAKRIVAAASK